MTFSKNHLHDFKTIQVVMGNEACDLDSAVSALVYGLIKQEESKFHFGNEVAVLSLLNIPKSDLPLKTEVTFYLKENNIHLDQLIFWDELNLKALHCEGKLQLILVDHHSLPPRDESLRSSVVEVVDHHVQDPTWEWKGGQVVTMSMVGSCCTLVTKKLLDNHPHLLTHQVAMLLYGPIILDTACFSASAARAKELDHEMAAELELKHLDATNREQVFQRLLTARTDISNLTTAQLLLKDLKFASGIPIPGLPMLVQDFVKRLDVTHTLNQFCAEKNVPVVIIMGIKITGTNVERDIAIFSTSPGISKKMAEYLSNSDPPLQLEIMSSEINGLTLFNQRNITASRKQVLPIIKCATEAINVSKHL